MSNQVKNHSVPRPRPSVEFAQHQPPRHPKPELQASQWGRAAILETNNRTNATTSRQKTVVNHRRVDAVLIFSATLGALLLLAHGLLLPGFALGGLTLAIMSQRYGADSPRPPLSKEEALALSGVKWDLADPIPAHDATARAPHGMQGGTP